MNMIEKGKQDFQKNFEHPRQIIFTIARVLLGLEFLKQGVTKLAFGSKYYGGTGSWSATVAEFKYLGIPVPELSTALVILVEIIAGLALIIGVMVPLASLFLIFDMIGAILLVTHKFGFDMTKGGWELNVIFIIALLMVGVANYGKYGADNAIYEKCCKK